MTELLTQYKKKRDFQKTKEPAGKVGAKDQDRFVVQKHNASQLHYDFRLEAGGVLKSWAVPKEPSIDSSVKRLAVLVEDHPVDYIDFKGEIPEGEYGAGTVEIWDSGKYENLKEPTIESQIENGQVEVKLYGNKLKGNFALVKFKGQKKNWMLIKMKDEKNGSK